MSRPHRHNRRFAIEHPTLDLLEETLSLLLRGGPAPFLYYYLGSIPFVVAFLFFTAEMSSGAYARAHLSDGALLLALAFGWMKTAQALFARRLQEKLGLRPPQRLTPRETLRLGLTQWLVQSTGLIVLPISAIITIPFGWCYAFYQSFTVNAEPTPLRAQIRRALDETRTAPLNNHYTIGIFSIGAFVLFLNLVLLAVITPFLLHRLTGIQLLFNQSFTALLNTTVLLVIAFATYLLFDPFVKAFYIVRSFHNQARTSGADIRIRLRSLRSAALLAAALLLPFSALQANQPSDSPPPPAPQRISRTMEEVLARPEFAWRAPRQEAADNSSPWIYKALRAIFRWCADVLEKIGNFVERFFNKDSERPISEPPDFSGISKALKIALYLFCFLLVLATIFLLWKARRHRRRPIEELTAAPLPPDITREDVTADQLPPDGWETMAAELIAKGELRLATRALYLAGLAHLGSRNWITLARAKSNLDFRREITRRAPMHPDLIETFRQNVTSFEKVWYGNHPVTRDSVEASTATLHRLRQF